MKCNQCGTEYEGKFCPNCGTKAEANQNEQGQQSKQSTGANSFKKQKKVKKPFYKKWWFIALSAIVVFAIIGGSIGGNKNNSKGEKINWNTIGMRDIIPQPESEIAEIDTNSAENLSIDVYKSSSSDYEEYVKKCEEKGFTVEEEKNSDSFKAYNAEGYKLEVSFKDYSDSYIEINLNAPMKMSAIQWPTSTVGKLLPAPKSLNGKFSNERDDSFSVYIGNTTIDDYSEYVTTCSNNGFNVDYDKGDNYYYADNSDGYSISLKYEGNNIMYITIDSPDKSNDTSSTEPEEPTEPTSKEDESPENNNSTGIRTEFKEAMDSYESFMDKYIAFMKKYEASDGTDPTLLEDYANYMAEYADVVAKFDKWEDEDLNDEEMAYYIDVQTRVSKKLLEV